MIARLTNAYIRLLFALIVLLFVSSLILHVSVLMGREELYARFGAMLFTGTVIVVIPAGLFEKDRDFWENEFKSCPRWLRRTVVVFAAYGFVVLCFQLIVIPNGEPISKQAMTVSAVPLSFDSIGLCVLYAVMWSDPLNESELVRRARNSVIAATLEVIVLLAHRGGHLLHPGK
jgi:hypothetical protein